MTASNVAAAYSVAGGVRWAMSTIMRGLRRGAGRRNGSTLVAMVSWLIGVVTGLVYDVVQMAARLKSEADARRLKARWALSLGVWNSGGADDYYLEELDRFLKEDRTLLESLEQSLPKQSTSFLTQRKKIWLAGFRTSRDLRFL